MEGYCPRKESDTHGLCNISKNLERVSDLTENLLLISKALWQQNLKEGDIISAYCGGSELFFVPRIIAIKQIVLANYCTQQLNLHLST